MNNEEMTKALADMVGKFVLDAVAKLRGDMTQSFDAMKGEITTMIDEAVKAIPVPKDGKDGLDGKDGKDGVDGKDGTSGENGKDGIDGKDGEPGTDGKDGLDGKDGADGRDATDGKDGEHGKDAVAISIMPSIDETKTYTRSTYATHNGGLWHAFEKTNGMRGWECIVNGITSVDLEFDGERGMKMNITTAAGVNKELAMKFPVVIYRGVYLKGDEYEQGDAVTFGGSLWVAEKNAPAEVPGTGADDGWKLAVKKGRDAKPVVRLTEDK